MRHYLTPIIEIALFILIYLYVCIIILDLALQQLNTHASAALHYAGLHFLDPRAIYFARQEINLCSVIHRYNFYYFI